MRLSNINLLLLLLVLQGTTEKIINFATGLNWMHYWQEQEN